MLNNKVLDLMLKAYENDPHATDIAIFFAECFPKENKKKSSNPVEKEIVQNRRQHELDLLCSGKIGITDLGKTIIEPSDIALSILTTKKCPAFLIGG